MRSKAFYNFWIVVGSISNTILLFLFCLSNECTLLSIIIYCILIIFVHFGSFAIRDKGHYYGA